MNIKLLAELVVLASLLGMPASSQEAANSKTFRTFERVAAVARAEWKKCAIGAVSIAVVIDGSTETLHLGHVDGKQGPEPTGATIYRLASVTKNFTAIAFLQLESRDQCNLSDSVEKYVPEFASIPSPPPSGAKVTLIQLATHTGGLERELTDAEDLSQGPVATWRETLLRAAPHASYLADPGSLFAYSNVGYSFLGAALEKAAGTPFTKLVVDQVLSPLEMHDTVFELTADQRKRRAPGFTISATGADTAESTAEELAGRGFRVPVGSLFSTLDDMQRWLRYQMGGSVPEGSDLADLPARQRRMTVSDPRLAWSYGIGVQVKHFGDVAVYGHSGGMPGYQAEMYFDPERKVGIVILRSAVFGEFDPGAIVAAAFVGAR